MSNYNLVLGLVEDFENDEVMDSFKREFKEGEDISKERFYEFFEGYIDDISELYYIRLNWEFVESGGDYSVYDELDEEEEEDEDE